jgi:hypothetical protein
MLADTVREHTRTGVEGKVHTYKGGSNRRTEITSN